MQVRIHAAGAIFLKLLRRSSPVEPSIDNRQGAGSIPAASTKSLLRHGAEAAREAHNLQVIGSSPIAATNLGYGTAWGGRLVCTEDSQQGSIPWYSTKKFGSL